MRKIVYILSFIYLLMCVNVQGEQPLSKSKQRIVGGTEVKRAFWPWMAALVRRGSKSLSSGHFCGGVLVHRQWILSAAHCVENMLPHEFDIVLDAHDLNTDSGDIYPVRKIIIHPEFDTMSLENDLVLIELKNDAPYTTIQPMITQDIAPGISCVVIGWGRLSENGPFSPKLQEVNVPIVSNEVCQQAFQKDPDHIQISSNMLCAGEPEGGRDACFGDSGGPLICRSINNWELAGLVSWGHGCARPDYYGVYTRISKYIGFIEQNVPSVILTGHITRFPEKEQPISQALIQLIDTEYQTFTDNYGYYSFDVPSGIFRISIQASHYLPIEKQINLFQRRKVVFYNESLIAEVAGDVNRDGITDLMDVILTLQRISDN